MKKIALLVGINYINKTNRLYGCHNDIIDWNKILIDVFDYKQEDIKILLDLEGYEYPTKQNIIKYMNLIIEETAKPNNIFEITFYYSGHGTNIKDIDGDETDKFDECLVPCDYIENGLIVDDYIYKDFLLKISPVQKIICIFDCCNSGSCTDLPFSFVINNNNNKIIKKSNSKRKQLEKNKNIYVISGCLDPKVSFDIKDKDNRPCGLLSLCLKNTLIKNNFVINIKQLLTDMKNQIGKIDQTPIISVGSSLINSNALIFNKNQFLNNSNFNNKRDNKKN